MSVWRTIWTSPKVTIRKLADAGDEQKGIALAALVGAHYGYQQFTVGQSQFAPDLLFLRKFWPAVALSSGFGGAVVNLVFVYFGGEVFQRVGRLFGAHCASNEARMALSWSQVPLLIFLATVFILNLPFNIRCGDLRSPAFGPCFDGLVGGVPDLPTIFTEMIAFAVVLVLWMAILFVAAMSEVLKLGLWRTLGSRFR